MAATIGLFPFLSRWLLCVEQPLSQSVEAIVVLGGDPGDRVPHAAELYLKGSASLVIVAGDGGLMAHSLEAAGVPRSAIIQEVDSTTTWENARNVSPILRKHGITKVVLVTSWWHTRRALACFRTVLPWVSLQSSHANRTRSDCWMSAAIWGRISLEYPKTVEYITRGKIMWNSWLTSV